MYRLRGDVSRLYRWSTIDFLEKDISRDIVEVWFSDLYGYWRTRLFSFFVNLEDKVVLRFW
jgi:hypothetical protein